MDIEMEIYFTPQQLEYLERLYPQQVHGPTTAAETMHHYFGQQRVVESVREKTRGLRNSLVPPRAG